MKILPLPENDFLPFLQGINNNTYTSFIINRDYTLYTPGSSFSRPGSLISFSLNPFYNVNDTSEEFAQYTISKLQIEQLTEALIRNTSITYIDINPNMVDYLFTDDLFQMFLKVFSSNSSITKCIINNTNLDDKMAMELVNAIASNPNQRLTLLDISSNKLNIQEGIKYHRIPEKIDTSMFFILTDTLVKALKNYKPQEKSDLADGSMLPAQLRLRLGIMPQATRYYRGLYSYWSSGDLNRHNATLAAYRYSFVEAKTLLDLTTTNPQIILAEESFFESIVAIHKSEFNSSLLSKTTATVSEPAIFGQTKPTLLVSEEGSQEPLLNAENRRLQLT